MIMTATLNWVALISDLNRTRERRGMTWAAVAAAAGVPSATVWRLAKGETITAGALLGVLAWAGLTDLRRYVTAGTVQRPEVCVSLPGDAAPEYTTTLTMPAALRDAIDVRAAERAKLVWRNRPNRQETMRVMLAYALEQMPAGWGLAE